MSQWRLTATDLPMTKPIKCLYEFGAFRLDVAERSLRRAEETVALTPKVFDLLVLLVENRGHLMSKEELLKALWPDSFIEEANLNVNVSALRKALGETPADPQYIETVPKRGYRFVASVRELSEPHRDGVQPLAEDANAPPQGIAGEAQPSSATATLSPSEESARQSLPQTAKRRPAKTRWLISAIATAIALIGVLAYQATRQNRAAGLAEIRTLAILPFKPSHATETDSALGLGMADALITKLSNYEQLTVRPTSAIQRYAEANADSLAAGRELGVDALLEGLVQRDNQRIRVTVKLMRTRDGKPLWADTFDDFFTNLFALQDSISGKMAEALALKLTGDEQRLFLKRPTEDTQAYQLYVQGQFYTAKLTQASANKALECYRQALDLDPDYALPYAGMADAYLTLATINRDEDWRQKAREAAEQAVRLDDRIADAHRALGLVKMHADWDWAGAEREFQRALELNPSHAMTRLNYSVLLTALARHEEAINEIEKARQLDPISEPINRDMAWTYYCARQYERSIEQCKKILEMSSDQGFAYRQLGKNYLQLGKPEAAIAEFKRSLNLFRAPEAESAELAQAYVQAGNRTQAETILTQIQRLSQQKPGYAYRVALAYACLQDTKQAFAWLERAMQERATAMIYLRVEPQFDMLKADKRFAELLRRLNLAP